MKTNEKDTPEDKCVLCHFCKQSLWTFLFCGENCDRNFILDMLENWSFPQLQEDSNYFILVQGGAPPHFHLQVLPYLKDTIPRRSIAKDKILLIVYGLPGLQSLSPAIFIYVRFIPMWQGMACRFDICRST
jgi:hypothetical protein